MTDTNALIRANAERWAKAKLTRGPEFTAVAKRLVGNKVRYLAVQARTGVPWFIVAVIDERESGGNCNHQLGQGDPLNEVSTHVPEGRGPFTGPNAFEDSAIDALMNCEPFLGKWKDWSAGGSITAVTLYNGLSYDNHGRPSPYAWSGTTIYDPPTGPGGKVLVDHGPIEDVYPSWHKLAGQRVIDQQLGCAGLILAMKAIDASVAFTGQAAPLPPPPDVEPIPAPQAPAPVNPIVALITAIFNAIFKKGN